ncbi:unnamed protein product [Chondrus crispus]|uniref:Uncharacterized protein n=1 Tax=Chondrus crispus TaxID=2769 RepID=R7QJK5_CHOCR|nr:unnamed protein product [Chondrus crispus]CDF37923.1 unnamed protein product [Chondrus crispus]|eukprot:XP_005717794.1 unnamed protein product [Chondrus crispus]
MCHHPSLFSRESKPAYADRTKRRTSRLGGKGRAKGKSKLILEYCTGRKRKLKLRECKKHNPPQAVSASCCVIRRSFAESEIAKQGIYGIKVRGAVNSQQTKKHFLKCLRKIETAAINVEKK